MSSCSNCSGNCTSCGGCSGGGCGGCSGCGGAMELHPGEIRMIRTLGQIPFLPVARRADSMEPHYLEESEYTPEEYSLILQCLEKRGLISIDYDPMKGFDYTAYRQWPVHGSFALTARGQRILEALEIQGIE